MIKKKKAKAEGFCATLRRAGFLKSSFRTATTPAPAWTDAMPIPSRSLHLWKKSSGKKLCRIAKVGAR